MKFEKMIQEARFRSPLKNFEEFSQYVEVRSDPLTGRRCRINVERARREKQVPEKTSELENVIEGSREKCYFCPERLESSTPMFAGGLPDRIRVGETCVFPNLFPFGSFHAVATLSDRHYLQLDEFTPGRIRDCFAACFEYFRLVQETHPELKFWNISWNWMPPGAASIIHPHLQIFTDSSPTLLLRELIEKSRDYYAKEQANYWSNLIKAEKTADERYIGQGGGVHWMASFAPQGNKEILAVIEDVSSLAQLKEKLTGFCEGFSWILKGYHELGIGSMNFATYSGPSDQNMREYYWLNMKLIARPYPIPFYIGDDGFMEKLHFEPVIETMPEDLARRLKDHFQ